MPIFKLAPTKLEITVSKLFTRLERKFLHKLNKISHILLLFIYPAIALLRESKIIIGAFLSFFISEMISVKIFSKIKPYHYFRIFYGSKTRKFKSFPSSHSAASFFFFLCHPSPIFLLVPILRIVALQHWLSDIAGSFVVAFLVYKVFF